MRVTSVSSEAVREELEMYLQLPSETPDGAIDWTRHHRVLPLMGDFVGCWGLTSAAQLVFYSWDDPERLDEVDGSAQELPLINAALVEGSRRYPRLAALRPPRPPDAVPCTSCDGSGRIPNTPSNVQCLCAGLGWLPSATRGAP